jgi:hypothetical protein
LNKRKRNVEKVAALALWYGAHEQVIMARWHDMTFRRVKKLHRKLTELSGVRSK